MEDGLSGMLEVEDDYKTCKMEEGTVGKKEKNIQQNLPLYCLFGGYYYSLSRLRFALCWWQFLFLLLASK